MDTDDRVAGVRPSEAFELAEGRRFRRTAKTACSDGDDDNDDDIGLWFIVGSMMKALNVGRQR